MSIFKGLKVRICKNALHSSYLFTLSAVVKAVNAMALTDVNPEISRVAFSPSLISLHFFLRHLYFLCFLAEDHL